MKRPQLVSSGTFRVDRAKALEKLRDFQTPEPGLFMLPWVRAAVANGARSISMDLAKDGSFTMTFDGPAIIPEQADPSACLFGEAPEPRLRQLAIGILAALRLQPKLVTLTSGIGADRRCLRLGTAGDLLESPESETDKTILWVISWGTVPADDWHIKVIDACRGCPALLRVGGTTLIPFDGDGAEGLMVREKGRRIWLEPLEASESSLDVYYLGVRASSWKRRAPGRAAVGGFIDDPALTLNASQTAVVRDAAWDGLGKAVDEATDRLVLHIASTQLKRLRQLKGWLRDKSWRRAWAWNLQRGGTAPWPDLRSVKREIFENAMRLTLWLRRMRARKTRLSADAALALRQAPLDPD